MDNKYLHSHTCEVRLDFITQKISKMTPHARQFNEFHTCSKNLNSPYCFCPEFNCKKKKNKKFLKKIKIRERVYNC